jgi:hypothetical protein
MRRDRIVRFALAAFFFGCAGQVFFDSGIASAQAPAPAATDPAAQPAPQANGGLQRQVTLSPPEMVAQSDADLARMEAGRSGVAKQLAKARQDRDVVKTLCLNDKLNQIDVAIRSAQERKTALDLAAKRGDGDLSNHEFTILSVLRGRSDQLVAEANQCIGEEAAFGGDAAVTMTVDGVPDDDDRPDLAVVVEPPQCSSCYL